jgi:hypothetical protein
MGAGGSKKKRGMPDFLKDNEEYQATFKAMGIDGKQLEKFYKLFLKIDKDFSAAVRSSSSGGQRGTAPPSSHRAPRRTNTRVKTPRHRERARDASERVMTRAARGGRGGGPPLRLPGQTATRGGRTSVALGRGGWL